MSFLSRILKLDEEEYDEFEEEIEEEIEEEEVQYAPRTPLNLGNTTAQTPLATKIVAMPAPLKKQEIFNITISEYSATGDIAKYIKEKKPVIVNMQNLTNEEMQRALDYLSGVSYALDGTVELVAQNIYVMVPDHIELNKE